MAHDMSYNAAASLRLARGWKGCMAAPAMTVNDSSQIEGFRRRFPNVTPAAEIAVPGRVNLIGEHVDYEGGIVLPMAIEPSIRIIAGPQGNHRLSVFSEACDESFECDLRDPESDTKTDWSAYVRGIAAELSRRGIKLAGAAIHVGGDLPLGAGLASSAALCAGIGLALLQSAGASLPLLELAKLCREAEHRAVGVPCGIMDPLVCMSARRGCALRIDCRANESRHIPWPDEEFVALVIDSRFRHELSEGEYGARVRECREAASILKEQDHRIESLRGVTPETLELLRAALDPNSYRRARHVVTEIDRADWAAAALERGDAGLFGRLMNESHASLRDDFDCCPPQIDALAAAIRQCAGVYGARMTGGGFGGCVVALARAVSQGAVASAVRTEYDLKFGVRARLWNCRPCKGATLAPSANA